MSLTHRNLIIGGHDAEEGRYPYFAVFNHFGGGVLIAPDIILTAGHCDPPISQHAKVRLNHTIFEFDDFTQEPDDAETFFIVRKERHPDYYSLQQGEEHVNDFNIFQLSGMSSVTPVKLNRDSGRPLPNQTVTVIGMGSTQPDPKTFESSAASTLQEVNLQIISQQQCENSTDPSRPDKTYQGQIVEESMVCTKGGLHNARDGCAFDSGSPLLLTYSNSHVREDTVVGLVSWGRDCADPFFPAVNARVSFAMDWVDQTVCKLSSAEPSQLTEFNCETNTTQEVEKEELLESVSVELKPDYFTATSFGGVGCVMLAVFLLAAVVRKFRSDNAPMKELTPLNRRIANAGSSSGYGTAL